MKQQRDPQPVPWFNRRDQYRLLAMVGLLCLVVIGMQLASQPEAWHWLLPPEGAADAQGERSATLEELDFRVLERDREVLPPEVFRAVASPDDPKGEGPNSQGLDDPQVSDDRDAPVAAGEVTIPQELLKQIRDNTIGVLRAEADAYHLMLDRVRQLPPMLRENAAEEGVAFTVIMLQPEQYRGRLVSATGHLQRLMPYPVMENDFGIDTLYEGWFFTNDSGNHPWRFVCSRLPEGATVGESLEPTRIRIIGYFFKRTGYPSRGGQHVAPTLLAESFKILPRSENAVAQMQTQFRNWMLGVVGVVMAGLAVLIWWFVRSDQKYHHSRLYEIATSRLDVDADELQALADLSETDSREFTAGSGPNQMSQ